MQPFHISKASTQLTEFFPKAEILLTSAKDMHMDERAHFLRLWLTEGIPSAFSSMPMLYETIRSWLANKLEIHPKEVTLIGSARIGYSLSAQEYGRPFNQHSDLDFTGISEKLFLNLVEAFNKWKCDTTQEIVHPRNDNQKKYWESNLTLLPRNIERGFVDPYKIPSLDRYPVVKKINNVLWHLQTKLLITPESPIVKKASIRIYRDWNTFVRQMSINFSNTIDTITRSC